MGKKIKIRNDFKIYIGPMGYLEIGNNCFFNNGCSINCMKKIKIGENNLFGENVKMYDHNHKFNDKSIDFSKNFTTNEIIIGDNNWFGSNIVVLSNTNIKNNNVIGAGAVINKKIENNKIIKINDLSFSINDIKYQ